MAATSQLSTIYATIAAATVTVGTTTVTALNGATLTESVESAQLPVRLILPIGGQATGSTPTPRTFANRTEGGVLVVEWTITDLLLWRGIDAGIGLSDLTPDLVTYCANYLSIVGSLRKARWSVTGITFPMIGGIEWPMSSNRWYSGVQAQLVIKEIV